MSRLDLLIKCWEEYSRKNKLSFDYFIKYLKDNNIYEGILEGLLIEQYIYNLDEDNPEVEKAENILKQAFNDICDLSNAKDLICECFNYLNTDIDGCWDSACETIAESFNLHPGDDIYDIFCNGEESIITMKYKTIGLNSVKKIIINFATQG